jgi:energy-coupling factor transporter ATP-binding protein EcfA2
MSARERQPQRPTPASIPITRLRVNDFKSLHELDVELGLVNVFVGANGSGKSNLLEAIGLLGAASAGRIDDQALLRRGVRPGVPELYKTALTKTKLAGYISIRAEGASGVDYEAHITNPIHRPKPWWVFTHENLRAGESSVASRSPKGQTLLGTPRVELENHASVAALARASLDVPPEVRSFLAILDDYAIFAPVTPVLRGIAPDTAPRAPVGLFGGQLPEAVSWMITAQGKDAAGAFLEDALSFLDWVESFEVGAPTRKFISPSVPTTRLVMQFHDRFMRKKRNVLSGYDASEGALYVLFMLVLALHDQAPRCFAIDNFDQALNPATAKGLAKVFSSACLASGRQAFLTTHNPLVLDGLPLDDDQVRLFVTYRGRDGSTKVRRVPVKNLPALKRKHGEDVVSRLWLTGRLGGMPSADL